MNEDQLKIALQQADRSAPVVQLPSDLADCVRRHARRQRRITLALSAAAAIVVVVISSFLLSQSPLLVVEPTPPVVSRAVQPSENLAQVQAEMAQLRAEIDERLAFIEKTLARQKQRQELARLQARLAAMPDPLEEINEQVEKAAFITLYQANRKLNELDLRDSALADYRRIVELFPQTRAAQTAREILAQNQTISKGDLL